MKSSSYDDEFYEKQLIGTTPSAQAICRVVAELVSPSSVADVGCGTGLWLKQFQAEGAEQILGIDGEWVDDSNLVIPRSNFITKDLEIAIDLGEKKKFDLAVSLEVAEHISSASAKTFVASLCNLSNTVLFSAAIPGQGGVHHVNEQWPDYWRDLFQANGFTMFDCIRKPVWNVKGITYYYAQNCFLFANKSSESYERLTEFEKTNSMGDLRVIHPLHYLQKIEFLDDPEKLALMGLKLPLRAVAYGLMKKLKLAK